jgi:S1-C subfamily serine protease
MKSLLRFLAFVVFVSLFVSGIYLWRSTQPVPSSAVLLSSPSPSSAVIPSKFAVLVEVDHEFADLVSRMMPSVVSITAIQQAPTDIESIRFFGNTPEFPPQLGSGVIVSREGHIVTNLHVIGGASLVQVHLSDGRIFTAQVLGADELTDLAILKIDSANLIPLALGNSDDVRVGQMVIAVGNPYGLQETVTRGIISAKGRRGFSETVNEFFQTDAAINPGNSGGPLIDLNGKIIAINNSILSDKGGWQGISFAIPSNTVKRVFDDIRKHGHVVHSWFGVITFPLTQPLAERLGISNQRGVFVYGILRNSPAQRAGLRPGDVIIGFNGKNIYDDIDLRNRVAETVVGQKIHARFLRDHSEKQVEVTIEKRPGV